MTAKEIRDIGYIKWKDPWAWMETMRGKRWENLIKREKKHFNELASQPHVERETRQMEKEIIDAQQYLTIPGFKAGCGLVDIIFIPGSKFFWKWSWSNKCIPAYDLDVYDTKVWYITSYKNDDYRNVLICEDSKCNKLWVKPNVSSQLAVINDKCYYIKLANYFTTVELCRCDANTGRNEEVIYIENDEEKEISLFKEANRTLYLKSEDPSISILYRVDGKELHQLYKNSMFQMPLGRSISGHECVLTKNGIDKKWIPHGKPIIDWILPEEDIQWINILTGHVLTIYEGSQTIWYCSNKKPKVLYKIKVGLIDPNVWSLWENNPNQTFLVKSPYDIPYMIHIIDNNVFKDNRKINVKNPIDFKPLEVHKYHTISKDGTKVPYILIKEKDIIPKAQFVYVYGAYGSTTPVNWPYQHWYPLLKRKWAIVFALVRGGGDIDASWADAARRENRHVSIEDFEAVIRDSQRKNNLGSDKTVIYGRSAGGLPIGAIVSRFPNGDLVGAAFTEVPYVDVLRTSSNPDLPLTMGEFKEFGNPKEKILNFKELLAVSPINTVPINGAPGVFVMSRVGLLDRQVFAYESFKWIQKLRGYSSEKESNIERPKGKYVTFEKDEAHQYSPKRFPRFRAIDLAILNSWVDGKLHLE